MSKQSSDFKKLEEHWYETLKKEGFNDIEDTKNIFRPLKSWHAFRFQLEYSEIIANARHDYYRCAELLLIHHIFQNKTHKRIWSLHCDGYSVRDIAKQIKEYKKSTIHCIVESLSKLIKKGNP